MLKTLRTHIGPISNGGLKGLMVLKPNVYVRLMKFIIKMWKASSLLWGSVKWSIAWQAWPLMKDILNISKRMCVITIYNSYILERILFMCYPSVTDLERSYENQIYPHTTPEGLIWQRRAQQRVCVVQAFSTMSLWKPDIWIFCDGARIRSVLFDFLSAHYCAKFIGWQWPSNI